MKNDSIDKKSSRYTVSEKGRVTAQDVRISMSKRSAKKSSNKKIVTAILIVVITCLIALTVIDIVFFNVEKIDVIGNERYDTEAIIESSGIENGTNFLLVRPRMSAQKIKTDIPGIKDVKVVRKLPSMLELRITESTPIMYITVGEFYYTLDDNMVVLEKFSSYEDIEMLGLMRVYFPEVSKCVAGEYITLKDADVLEMIKELNTLLHEYELAYDVNQIDFRDKFDIRFTLGTKYTVKIGNIIDCDIKLEFLKGILSELDEGDVGTIDLSDGNIREAIFTRE